MFRYTNHVFPLVSSVFENGLDHAHNVAHVFLGPASRCRRQDEQRHNRSENECAVNITRKGFHVVPPDKGRQRNQRFRSGILVASSNKCSEKSTPSFAFCASTGPNCFPFS